MHAVLFLFPELVEGCVPLSGALLGALSFLIESHEVSINADMGICPRLVCNAPTLLQLLQCDIYLRLHETEAN